MEQFFDPVTDTQGPTIGSYLGTLEPYVRRILSTLGPVLPPLIRGTAITIRVLSPFLHTLRLLLLSATSLGLTIVLKILYVLPPSMTPVLILISFLAGLWLTLTIMSLLRRATAFILAFMFRMWLLGALLGAAWYIKERGVTESLQDVGWGIGVLKGWWEEGKDLGDGRAKSFEQEHTQARWDYMTIGPRRW